ncbi:MAG: OsmC family protein [Bdellovibrionota bacterium]
MSLVYQGEKHCELTHEPSGSKIETDAPKDNAGRGERFSPTDLVGAALASCVVTTMAIMGEKHGITLVGMNARFSKEMNPQPRRIARLPIEVDMPKGLSPEDRKKLEAAAHACPVKRSLSEEVETPMTFNYPD